LFIATGYSQWRGRREEKGVAEREQYIWRSVLEGFTFGLLLATFVQVISADINTESGISVMAEQLQRQ
jgi:hypothetical protein